MRRFTGSVAGVTTAADTMVFALESVAGQAGFIDDFNGGGLSSLSVPVLTVITRDSAVGTGTRTAGDVQHVDRDQSGAADNAMYFTKAYGTAAPTARAGALLVQAFNACGGVFRWLAAPGEEFYLSGANSIEARNVSGVASVAMGIVWAER